ncbi:hypothetical protein CIB84_011143 [Bambusicola thoracicus]|uniref:Uncharacterized protein n=1 Tax=Bambusicola thoracicus TaxID=9083 RepID=A0A2P4SLW0_BAMTH|nr:hypothetical protein CIB84_011143 [Bambusicola thoracicus]
MTLLQILQSMCMTTGRWIGKKNKSAVQISCGLFIKGGFFMAM